MALVILEPAVEGPSREELQIIIKILDGTISAWIADQDEDISDIVKTQLKNTLGLFEKIKKDEGFRDTEKLIDYVTNLAGIIVGFTKPWTSRYSCLIGRMLKEMLNKGIIDEEYILNKFCEVIKMSLSDDIIVD